VNVAGSRYGGVDPRLWETLMVAQNHDNQGSVLEEALTRFVDECLHGKQPDVDEFVEQYPQCKAQLKVRLQDLEQIDSLFDSLVQADESDFEVAEAGHDLVGQTKSRKL